MKRIFCYFVYGKEDGSMKGSKTFHYAFAKSLPVMFGYLFLGSAFGVQDNFCLSLCSAAALLLQ